MIENLLKKPNILFQCKKAVMLFNGHLSPFYSSQPPAPCVISFWETVDLSHHPHASALLVITYRRVQMICHCVVKPRKGGDLMAVYCSGSKQRALVACV